MRKASDSAGFDPSSESKDENRNFFSNSVFNENNDNNYLIGDKPDNNNKNKNKPLNEIKTNNEKDLIEIPNTKLISNYKNDSNDFFRNENPNSFQNEKPTKELQSEKKNTENNDSFMKEFQDLMKEAKIQPNQIKTNENPFNPFSDSSSNKLNNQKPIVINELNPFENSNLNVKQNETNKGKSIKESKEKNPFDIGSGRKDNNPYASSFGKEILFPKVDVFSNKGSNENKIDDKNFNKIDNSNIDNLNDKIKKELSDEDILNNLLGITSDFNKAEKKDPSSAKLKKKPSAALIVPGSEGIVLSNLENKNRKAENNLNNLNNYNNNNSKIKENTNFFNVLEKETKNLKKSNSENLDFFGAPSAKKGDIGINKIFEDVVKEEEKAQQKKIVENLKKKETNNNLNNINDNNLSALDFDLETGLNQTSEKLDREFKKIPISLAQLDTTNEENARKGKKKKKKVYLK